MANKHSNNTLVYEANQFVTASSVTSPSTAFVELNVDDRSADLNLDIGPRDKRHSFNLFCAITIFGGCANDESQGINA